MSSEIFRTRVRVKRLDEKAIIPRAMSLEAAGVDLCSIEALVLGVGERRLVRTGLAVSIPRGTHLEIRPRSGLALKHGVSVLNSPGTVDSDYRGELMITLINLGEKSFEISVGDRIAQAVLMRHFEIEWEDVEYLDETERGARGWGSSGR